MIDHLLQYGYFLVFFGVAIEGDATLVAASFLAHHGHFDLTTVLLVALGASILTDELFYWLAHKRGRAMFERKAQESPQLQRVRRWVTHHGIPLLLFSRFLWGFRVAIPAACGATGMRHLTFSALNIAGALLWALPLGFGGYGLAGAVANFIGQLHSREILMALALLAAGIVAIIWHRRDVTDEALALTHPDEFGTEAAEEIFEENHTHHSRLLSLIPED